MKIITTIRASSIPGKEADRLFQFQKWDQIASMCNSAKRDRLIHLESIFQKTIRTNERELLR